MGCATSIQLSDLARLIVREFLILNADLGNRFRGRLGTYLGSVRHAQHKARLQQVDVVVDKSIGVRALQRQHRLLNRYRIIWAHLGGNGPESVTRPRYTILVVATFGSTRTGYWHCSQGFPGWLARPTAPCFCRWLSINLTEFDFFYAFCAENWRIKQNRVLTQDTPCWPDHLDNEIKKRLDNGFGTGNQYEKGPVFSDIDFETEVRELIRALYTGPIEVIEGGEIREDFFDA